MKLALLTFAILHPTDNVRIPIIPRAQVFQVKHVPYGTVTQRLSDFQAAPIECTVDQYLERLGVKP